MRKLEDPRCRSWIRWTGNDLEFKVSNSRKQFIWQPINPIISAWFNLQRFVDLALNIYWYRWCPVVNSSCCRFWTRKKQLNSGVCVKRGPRWLSTSSHGPWGESSLYPSYLNKYLLCYYASKLIIGIWQYYGWARRYYFCIKAVS